MKDFKVKRRAMLGLLVVFVTVLVGWKLTSQPRLPLSQYQPRSFDELMTDPEINDIGAAGLRVKVSGYLTYVQTRREPLHIRGLTTPMLKTNEGEYKLFVVPVHDLARRPKGSELPVIVFWKRGLLPAPKLTARKVTIYGDALAYFGYVAIHVEHIEID